MIERKRLERLLHLREQVQAMRKSNLASAERDTSSAQANVEQADTEASEVASTVTRRTMVSAAQLSVDSDMAGNAHLRLRHAETRLAACRTNQAARTDELVRASRDVRALEIAVARRRAEDTQRISKSEQTLLDEVASRPKGVSGR